MIDGVVREKKIRERRRREKTGYMTVITGVDVTLPWLDNNSMRMTKRKRRLLLILSFLSTRYGRVSMDR